MTRPVLVVGATSPIGAAIGVELDRRGVSNAKTARTSGHALQRLDVDDPREVQDMLATVEPVSVIYLASPREFSVRSASVALASLERFANEASRLHVESMIFASSAAVYGTNQRTPRQEDDPLDPQGHYGQFKIDAETVLSRSSRELGLRIVSLRLFNVYGQRLEASLINRMFSGGTPPEVFATRHFVRDYVHVRDVAQSFVAATSSSVPGFTAINVGTGVGTDNLTLLADPGAHGTAREVPPDFSSYSIADVQKMRAMLRQAEPVRLEEAIAAADRFLH